MTVKIENIENDAFERACEHYWTSGCDKDRGLALAEDNWPDFLTDDEAKLFE